MLWINLSKGKIMVAMIIMVVEANNDGNNIKYSFLVVLEGGCCFFGEGHQCGWAVFIKA